MAARLCDLKRDQHVPAMRYSWEHRQLKLRECLCSKDGKNHGVFLCLHSSTYWHDYVKVRAPNIMMLVWTYGLLSFSVKAAWCLGCDSPSPQGCYKYGSSDSRDSDSGISRCCKSVYNIIFQKSRIFTNRPTFWISNTVLLMEEIPLHHLPIYKTLVNNGDFNYQPQLVKGFAGFQKPPNPSTGYHHRRTWESLRRKLWADKRVLDAWRFDVGRPDGKRRIFSRNEQDFAPERDGLKSPKGRRYRNPSKVSGRKETHSCETVSFREG